MNAYAIAAELLGNLELGPEQCTQLRAIDYRFQLEVQRRLHGRKESATPGPPASPPPPTNTAPALTPHDPASLRAMIVADIRDMLTPEQRAALDRR